MEIGVHAGRRAGAPYIVKESYPLLSWDTAGRKSRARSLLDLLIYELGAASAELLLLPVSTALRGHGACLSAFIHTHTHAHTQPPHRSSTQYGAWLRRAPAPVALPVSVYAVALIGAPLSLYLPAFLRAPPL